MESKLGKCPFFKSVPGCIPEAVCMLSGKSRTALGDGLYIKPVGCEYPLITNNDCDVEEIPDLVVVRTDRKPTMIGQEQNIVFSDKRI